MRKPCFVYFTLCLFSCCHMVLWVKFSIYTLLFSLHCVYVLDMHTSLYYCAFLVACSDNHLLCYVIIVVISKWLFCVWLSCSYVSHYIYLIAFLLVTLYNGSSRNLFQGVPKFFFFLLVKRSKAIIKKMKMNLAQEINLGYVVFLSNICP